VPAAVKEGLPRAWTPETGRRAALALALCGRASAAERLIQELIQRFPRDTLVNALWAPTLRAAVVLRRGDPARTLALLAPVERYEGAGEFWPPYLRGTAALLGHAPEEAAVEFQKIIDRRGQAPLSVLWPIAHLGLARAAARMGDAGRSRAAYQALLDIWKDADPDFEPRAIARRELRAGS
jgi:hypothetical protein